MSRLSPLAVLTAVAVSLSGCGAGPKIVPVSGRVLIDGKPVERGTVQVVPAGFRPAMGSLGPDGRFTLTTLSDGDGCPVGTHPVAVIAFENVGPTAVRWLAPKKYVDFSTSGLTVTIDGPTADLAIDLTWAGGKPFVERSEAEK